MVPVRFPNLVGPSGAIPVRFPKRLPGPLEAPAVTAGRMRKPPGLGDMAVECPSCGATTGPRLVEPPCTEVVPGPYIRDQVMAAGYNEFFQGFPLPPASTGIRIPLLPLTNTFYRVLCARLDLDDGDAITGIRQGIDIGAIAGTAVEGFPIAPMYPIVRPVVSPNWTFVDAMWRWVLTREPMSAPQRIPATGPLDQDSFVFEDSSSPALVYATAAIPVFAGAALPTYTGLTAYTPPALRGKVKAEIREIRWPVDQSTPEGNLFFRVERPERWRLYCDVMQTNPTTRNTPTLGGATNTLASALPAEELFLQFCQNISTSLASLPIVWRVHGGIVYERARRECR